MLQESVFILKFGLFCFLLGFILFVFSYFLVFQSPDFEKLSSYECGFQPFGDTRSKFEVRFYLVAILFIIFDLEISFFFP
jgi:NADH-quinone oxidoreductase subunit A